jgi:hypothetical protein
MYWDLRFSDEPDGFTKPLEGFAKPTNVLPSSDSSSIDAFLRLCIAKLVSHGACRRRGAEPGRWPDVHHLQFKLTLKSLILKR